MRIIQTDETHTVHANPGDGNGTPDQVEHRSGALLYHVRADDGEVSTVAESSVPADAQGAATPGRHKAKQRTGAVNVMPIDSKKRKGHNTL